MDNLFKETSFWKIMANNLEEHVIKLVELGKLKLVYLQGMIDLVVKEKATEGSEIEYLLDQTLDLMFLGIGESEFLKLYSYYGQIDPMNEVLKYYFGRYKQIIEGWEIEGD